jgi:hypothetical protein
MRRRFPETLHACVAAHDPDSLPDVEAGRGYPLSGWFIDTDQHKAVLHCMALQNWYATPTTLLMP